VVPAAEDDAPDVNGSYPPEDDADYDAAHVHRVHAFFAFGAGSLYFHQYDARYSTAVVWFED